MASSDQGAEGLDKHIPGAFPEGNASQPTISTTQQTLSQTLFERRAEYCRPKNVRIKVGTWNVAGLKGCENDVGAWFVQGKGIEESLVGLRISEDTQARESVAAQEARSSTQDPTVPRHDSGRVPGGDQVGIYALGLQEVVDINSPAEALRPFTDPSVANRWKDKIESVLPPGYELVAEQQLIGLLLLVYASPEIVPHVKSVSTTSVGTGLMGYMGNKGAVTARIVLGETTRLVFINSHLAAGSDKVALDRRNWDFGQIESRTRFAPITDTMHPSQSYGEQLGEEDFAFWCGDLNYRLEGIPGEDVRRLLTIHTKGLDSKSSQEATEPNDTAKLSSPPSSSPPDSPTEDAVPLPPELDPASLHTTLACLLPHDELHQQQRLGKAFHDGWKEGPIRFLPTYKYDVGKVGVFDSSEKKRGPSWCDRILYRTRASKQRYEAQAKEQEEARKRDEEMKAKGMDNSEDVLYDYDPETDAADADADAGTANADGYEGTTINTKSDYADYDEYDEDAEPEPESVTTKEGFHDEITLEYYTSHMRVLSSDHKPLDAIFNLKFDAVIPELKATIHTEIARELDRLENEGRPSIAVVVDRGSSVAGNHSADNSADASFDGVDFGDIQYAKSKRRGITIANTGRVPATFWFADRPAAPGADSGPLPSWLLVTFDREPDEPARTSPDTKHIHKTYTLQPAEVCNAELKLKIDTMDAVRHLNEGTTVLDEILVLRVQDGRDHFLPLRGRWLQSSLARNIEKLVRIPEGGIRKLQHQKPDSSPLGDSSGGEEKVRWSVPREIFRLTEAVEDLTARAVAEWGMTHSHPYPHSHHIGDEEEKAPWQVNPGWPFLKDPRYFEDAENEDMLANVFDALDCDTPFEEAFPATVSAMQRVEILAEVLLRFLGGLTDGVVAASLWERLERGIAEREKSSKSWDPDDEKFFVLETMSSSPAHNASFLLLMTMLERVAKEVSNASIQAGAASLPLSQTHSSGIHVGGTGPGTPRASLDSILSSPGKQGQGIGSVRVRRKTLSKVPEEALRQLVNKNYAAVFADKILRGGGDARDKDRAKGRERMSRIIELFITEVR